MNIKQGLPLIGIAVSVALVSAYQSWTLNGLLGGAPKSTARQSALGSASRLPPAEQAMTDKLKAFITCINRVDSKMQENIVLYRQQLKVLTASPTNPQWSLASDRFRSFKIAPFEQANNFSLECADGLDKAQGMTPKDDELDNVARDYAATLRALIPLMNKADLYYDQKDYADDKMAKGRVLDKDLSPLFDGLIKQSGVMRNAVGTRNDTLQASRLVALEQANGRDIEWQTLNVMIVARRSFMDLQRSVDGKVLTKQALAAAEAPLQTAYDEAKTVADKLKPRAEGSKERKPVWLGIDSAAATFLGRIKFLRREIEAGKPETVVNYALDSLDRGYNDLVSAHNQSSRF
jgi:Protein of unknown function (DUF3829)